MTLDNGLLLERAVAVIADSILISLFSGLLFGLAVFITNMGTGSTSGLTSMAGGLAGFAAGFFGLFYFVLLESRDGQTLGKKLMNIRVVSDTGTPSMLESLIRNLLRIVDILPTFYIVGALAVALTSEGQRVGDLAAGTRVRKA